MTGRRPAAAVGAEALRIVRCVLWSAALLLVAEAASAQDNVAAFYRGKQMRMIVGSSPGGGYDLFARAVARHIVDHIPGNPTIIVQNLAAAGGLVMVNQLFALGPKDGTVIGAPINGIPTAPMMQPAGAHFDAGKLNWLGSTNREAYVAYVWHTVPVQSLEDVMRRDVVVGATTPGTTMTDFPAITNKVLGTRFKIVRGYESTPQINVAMERGEIEGNAALGWASLKTQSSQWIADKKIRVLAQYGLRRDRELAEIPTMLDLATSDADRQAMTMMFARTEYGRPYFVPPDVPAERLMALRRAFDATMKDPAFIADAGKLQLDLDPITGEVIQELIRRLAGYPPEVIARVRAALEGP
jgi:tripartite-type tricarboxylate transporter receptor subunit TctC